MEINKSTKILFPLTKRFSKKRKKYVQEFELQCMCNVHDGLWLWAFQPHYKQYSNKYWEIRFPLVCAMQQPKKFHFRCSLFGINPILRCLFCRKLRIKLFFSQSLSFLHFSPNFYRPTCQMHTCTRHKKEKPRERERVQQRKWVEKIWKSHWRLKLHNIYNPQ